MSEFSKLLSQFGKEEEIKKEEPTEPIRIVEEEDSEKKLPFNIEQSST